ncbi:MFS general substrate transporter [Punctularia strigosozonata HHB-11173 SS5]|uniref:MFS general substrate transporter n=1 Tax=Punctularia strigosozonata (strain HHB-11173) TaxID=741275 RepID=UPI00044183DE|nr:MFS general substrate transporter [Punctularia strigosozonata HHB-11173 SS5]EIN06039.1 MFS general substrate transporter [Punctularia strigosozonata HHB-11173 SS5]
MSSQFHDENKDPKVYDRSDDEKSIVNEKDAEAQSVVSEEAQDGLKKVEAITAVWSNNAIITAYGCIFLVYFVNSLQQQTNNNLTAYVTSSFASHPLVATTSIVSSIVGGVTRLPIAKMLDVWGRAEGFLVMTVIATIGRCLIMMAACKNVETYAAAQVFYWVGMNGMNGVLDIFIADTSKLKNRGLMWGFASTPYIATTFAGPAIAQRFLDHSSWQWSFGAFSIITPAIAMPIASLLLWHQRKAIKLGILKREQTKRTLTESIKHFCIEWDVFGMILICAGWSLFLLPFSLATSQANKWQSGNIIAMIVVGGLCIIAFAIYERYWSPKSFIPFDLLKDRTVAGACLLAGILFFGFYCWDGYFYSYLQVVWGLSVKDAGYVSNTYSIGSCFWSVVVGYVIRRTGRFKHIALAAVPLNILGAGLMIHFRQPDVRIGYVVMCQIFIAFAGGTLVICEEIAVMAADSASHSTYAVSLALLTLASDVGGAIGSSVSGAIWTNTFPKALRDALPASEKNLTDSIYASIVTQLSYPFGSPERDAINHAYGVAQKQMCIAATVVLVGAVGAVLMWRDIRLHDIKAKGRVV